MRGGGDTYPGGGHTLVTQKLHHEGGSPLGLCFSRQHLNLLLHLCKFWIQFVSVVIQPAEVLFSWRMTLVGMQKVNGVGCHLQAAL